MGRTDQGLDTGTSVTAFLPGLKKTVMAAIAKKEESHFYWIITANMEAISITMP